MPRYRVIRSFMAKAIYNATPRVISVGDELIFIRWMGEGAEATAIFAIPTNDPERRTTLGPLYEVDKDLFEISAEKELAH